jgi:hypothetical protein
MAGSIEGLIQSPIGMHNEREANPCDLHGGRASLYC